MATPKSTQLYGKLSAESQAKFGEAVIEKLRTLIGGYGELSVLAEYIAVMLQSSRPPEQIQSELDAFLQEESRPFTDWLCNQLATFAGEAGSAQSEAKGEALLLRAVRDARQGSGGEVAPVKVRRSRREEAQVPEGRREERQHREKRSHAAAAPAPVERAARHRGDDERSRSRQRSRPRRRHGTSGQRREAEEVGNSAGSREAVERKATLTPNVQFLRDAYHQKEKFEDEGAAPPTQPDTRWHFRAEPAPLGQGGYDSHPAAALTPAPPAHGYPPPGPPPPQHHGAHHYGPPPGALGAPHGPPHAEPVQPPPVSSSRPRFFPPKKWRVARPNTMVRATEHLDSEEVQLVQEGEIIEQVAPAFKLKNGIVRIQVRHPSSPQFPNPIGWVTQDATAAGGPKFLEPGPEPMSKGKGWPKGGPPMDEGKGWSPPEGKGDYGKGDYGKGDYGKGKGWQKGGPGAEKGGKHAMAPERPGAEKGGAPAGPRGPYGTFQNLTWKPGGGGGDAPAVVIPV